MTAANKDGLIIDNAVIDVTAIDEGIRGKDYLVVKEDDITVKSGGDVLKSDNEDNATLGYVSMRLFISKN